MTISEAIPIFVEAFCRTKSRTYPYVGRQTEPGLWLMQDDPPRAKARKAELISTLGDPGTTVARIEAANIGWHFVCDIQPPEADFQTTRYEYKQLGYRAVCTEWLFFNDLLELPARNRSFPIARIDSAEALREITQCSSQPRKFVAGTLMFAVHTSVQDLGWVTLVPVGIDHWVSDLWVRPEFRGQGIGTALMTELLHFARENGDRSSVLLATAEGARIYPRLGYEKIGVLQMFCPLKRPR